MRVSTVVTLGLPFLVATETMADLAFTDLATGSQGASNQVVGHLATPHEVNGTVFSAPPMPSISAAAPSAPRSHGFAALDGSFDAARLGDVGSTRPSATEPAVVSVVVLTDAGSVAFSALPVSPANDIQGFPFGADDTANATQSARMTPQADNETVDLEDRDESWW